MYIRPLVNVHHVTVIMSYVRREKNVIIQICSYLGVGYSKIQYSSVQRKKVTSHLKMEKALASVVINLSPILSIHYAQYPDFN